MKYYENLGFFFQHVLVLFDGCMIVHLLFSHVFGSVTSFVYMWKLSFFLFFDEIDVEAFLMHACTCPLPGFNGFFFSFSLVVLLS